MYDLKEWHFEKLFKKLEAENFLFDLLIIFLIIHHWIMNGLKPLQYR